MVPVDQRELPHAGRLHVILRVEFRVMASSAQSTTLPLLS
jgi:hypothetical protein